MVPDDLNVLYRLFRSLTSSLPHGFPPELEEFALSFMGIPINHQVSQTLVAEENGEIVGFARVGKYAHVPDRWTLAREGEGLIFGPMVLPERRMAGMELLYAAEQFLNRHRSRLHLAFDPVESVTIPYYNGGWCGLSEKLTEVVQTLVLYGFRVRHREFCLTCRELELSNPSQPDSPYHLQRVARDSHRFVMQVFDRKALVGSCYYSLMNPTTNRHPDAKSVGYINGLSVQQNYQGRGLGRLLMCHTLKNLRELGCTQVCLTTGAENYRAQNLYYSLRFALVDSTITLSR
jgi:ribosomal protein S18 acetylase RimI-like enzyme